MSRFRTRLFDNSSRWDALAQLAMWPVLAKPRYGQTAGRTGGAQLENPQGWAWPMSDFTNCCVAAIVLLHLARHALGVDGELSREDWETAMIQKVGDAGIADVAVRWGLATEVVSKFPALTAGQWFACQGWNGNSGHTFFARAMRMGGGKVGLVYLEANGQAAGGSVLGGLDGVGSRHCEVRNARDWGGRWPVDKFRPVSAAEVQDTYQTLHIAQLT